MSPLASPLLQPLVERAAVAKTTAAAVFQKKPRGRDERVTILKGRRHSGLVQPRSYARYVVAGGRWLSQGLPSP